MEDNVKRAIGASLAEVFERMFFTLLEPLDSIPPREEWSAEEEIIEASIAYAGQINGVLRFLFPRGLALGITANFLGGDESEVSDGQVIDTVREAVNMAVGSMLGRIDPEGRCTLGIPEARLVGDFSPESVIADLGLYVFNSNFGHLWVIYSPR